MLLCLERNNFLLTKLHQFVCNFTAYHSPRRPSCGETVVFSRSMQILVAFSSLNVPTIIIEATRTYTSCHYLPSCIGMCVYVYAINQIKSNQIKKITRLLHVRTFSLDFVAIYTLAKTNIATVLWLLCRCLDSLSFYWPNT